MKKLLFLFISLIISMQASAEENPEISDCTNRTAKSDHLIIYIAHCTLIESNNRPLNVSAQLKDPNKKETKLIVSFNNKRKLVTVKQGDLAELINEDHYKDGFDKVKFNFYPTQDEIIMLSQ